MHKNNKSKHKGVSYNEKGKNWRAEWRNENGKTRVKTFSVKKFGFEEAKRLAIQAREEAISSLPHYRDALNLNCMS